MILGTIVASDSHISYACRIYDHNDVKAAPKASDYALGRFVRALVASGRPESSDALSMYNVGVISDTRLSNPSFRMAESHLSTRQQNGLFFPDVHDESAVITSILVLGTLAFPCHEQDTTTSRVYTATQGISPYSLELGTAIETMSQQEIAAFHFLHEADTPFPLLNYLTLLIAQRSGLPPLVALQILDQLERLIPEQRAKLSIVKRNLSWRMNVLPVG